ncbi:uncharacterized protein LOC120078587 isoform X2 [Benincasa hispida]|uniref:uncharacterized protein LOC120078587 isoform X2 n=1 Tax=Benincasa hispida TaxID=102211 RepID=UPI0019017992|nr:uncharacterized protein LOC120078587 isoform X2 [Benincasa hispida]
MRKVKDEGSAVSVPMPNPEINTTGTGTGTADDEAITDAGNSSQPNDNPKDWPAFPVARLPSRNTSSKYDFVKVKVWLGDNADHYYVLSRFLLSRMLTVTKIPNHVAIKIALELKKLLVDNSLLDVSQSDLEANIFKLMERRGYGEEYINRYKMMTSAPLTSTPVWARDFSSPEELITEFCRECRIVRKGLAGDLKKAMKDGKPIIIEGIHLDPSIYLMDDESKSSANISAKGIEENPLSATSDDKSSKQMESSSLVCQNKKGTGTGIRCSHSKECMHTNQENEGLDSLEAVGIAGNSSGITDESHNKEETSRSASVKKDKSGAEPIIIPIVLKMAEFDHKALLEEWVCPRTFSDKCPLQDKDKLIANLKTIQDYLCSFKSQGLIVVNISATTFPQTLDWLHGYILQCIEQGISPVSNENASQSTEH